MNPLESFSSFYKDLDKASLFLFWAIVIFIFILIVMVITLILKNKELKRKISSLENKDKVEENTKEEVKEKVVVNEKEKHLKKSPLQEDKKYVIGGAYSRNVLKDIGTKNQLSPIAITSKMEVQKDNEKLHDTQKLDAISLESEDKYYESLNDGSANFIEEVSKKLENDLTPKTIELTEYEKHQEEDAVISYQDLMKRVNAREKTKLDRQEIEVLDDDDFLNELKSFRNSL